MIKDLSSLRNKSDKLIKDLVKESGRRDQILDRKKSIEDEIFNLNKEQVLLQQTSEVLKTLLDKMSVENISKIEKLVTFGLNTIFGDKYSGIKFFIERSTKRDQLNYDFMLEVDGVKATIDGNFGGGMACVVSIIMRLILTVNLGLYRFVVLDESLSGVSEEFQQKTADFIRVITEQLGLDILLVTHQEQFALGANKRYKCNKDEKNDRLIMKIND